MAPWQSISNGKGRSLVFLHHLLTIARASISRFLADLHDLNRSQVLPMLEPHVEEGRVICLHQLKAPITVLLQPTVHVDQTVRQHSAFLMKPLIDIVFSTWQEGLDNHVSLHRRVDAWTRLRQTDPLGLGAHSIRVVSATARTERLPLTASFMLLGARAHGASSHSPCRAA